MSYIIRCKKQHHIFLISIDKGDSKLERMNHVLFKALKQDKNCNERRISINNVKLVQCNHNGYPAWAQNDAIMEGYIDGMDYFYRINDDTLLLTPDWTTMFVNVLKTLDPSNVGVVGPTHYGGNTDILTYDFTSEKHIEIFGFHYPRVFTNWYAGTENFKYMLISIFILRLFIFISIKSIFVNSR